LSLRIVGSFNEKIIVNITVETLAPCKKLLRVELPATAVDEAFATITKNFQKQASFPGFRAGKAPLPMVLKKYEGEIKEEAKRHLISETYRKALEAEKIAVVANPDIEEVQFERGQTLIFTATVETAPTFELPEYKGIPVKRETREVVEADIDKALELLAKQQTKFETVAREVRNGDIAVVNYTGTVDGKPITDLAPTAKGLTEQKAFWVEIMPDKFIPGFGDQLIGAVAGEHRTVNVDFPQDFVAKELVGLKGVYQVEVVEVKERALPPIDDAFAKTFGAEDLGKLREGVRRDLANELAQNKMKSVRGQIVGALFERVNFELPEVLVAEQTRKIIYEIVQENTKRGVAREAIENERDKIAQAASASAKDRVKLAFIVQGIAVKEGIQVSQEEAIQRIQLLSQAYEVPFEKFVKDLQARNGVNEIYEQISQEKVMRYLELHAQYEDVTPPVS
jgi:trigger factor